MTSRKVGARKAHLASVATFWVAPRLPVPIACEFSYDMRDPYAVTLILDSEGELPVRWVFSRELLACGLEERVGEGDVTMWPEHPRTEAWLLWLAVGRDPRTALFEMPAEPISEWLPVTYRLVPEGEEAACVDWNALTHLSE